MSIKIFTAFHPSTTTAIERGEVQEQFEIKTTPRNLLIAANERLEISQMQESGWGSIGHQGTWIEIDGVRIDNDDISEIEKEHHQIIKQDYDRYNKYDKYPSRTEIAKDLINDVKEKCYKPRAEVLDEMDI
ncbi:hypothetical protein [Litoribrevibacter albus]|uniref:Uncharacterized protein n=1 Tax=Litoribrevibacter albus TaxID=1473156 RepID=A0AA37SAF0_9GAMM|nr:hypothetical protein [Litoribrevibacter albus]GLQ31644.1 hypothetical protein GCM10007876_21230 [Litoribrevibacter albus]